MWSSKCLWIWLSEQIGNSKATSPPATCRIRHVETTCRTLLRRVACCHLTCCWCGRGLSQQVICFYYPGFPRILESTPAPLTRSSKLALYKSCNNNNNNNKYLKVLEFFSPKFKALKVLGNRTGAWKFLNFTKSNCAVSAALLNRCFGFG